MTTITVRTPVKTDETIYPTMATDSDFAILVEHGNRYDESVNKALADKRLKTAKTNLLHRIPEVFALRECQKRIRYYENQQSNLDAGELPTKILSHPKSRKDDLLREYREGNQLVLDALKEQEKKLRKIADSVPEAAELEIEIAMLQKSIDQHRQTRKNVARYLRQVRNVGKTGIAYWNPDRTKMFSMRIYPESSSNN
jgi:hypothetical protein